MSTSGTKTTRKHGSTRDSILDAGLQLFSERGFEGVSVKDIEAAVGLAPGRGSFYRHFKSKEALLETVIQREVERARGMRGLQQRVSGSLGDRRAELILQYRLSLIGLEQIKTMINLLAREYGHFPELMQQLHELLVDESLEISARDYANDIEQGTLHGSDAQAIATVVQSALVGYHLSKSYFGSSPHQIDSERFIQALAGLLINK